MKRVRSFLLAILALCSGACHRDRYENRSVIVDVATLLEFCGDSRDIVVSATGKHRARLNGEYEGTIVEVTRKIHEIMLDRAEKVVFVKAEAGVSWGELLKLVDHVRPEVDVVSILHASG